MTEQLAESSDLRLRGAHVTSTMAGTGCLHKQRAAAVGRNHFLSAYSSDLLSARLTEITEGDGVGWGVWKRGGRRVQDAPVVVSRQHSWRC